MGAAEVRSENSSVVSAIAEGESLSLAQPLALIVHSLAAVFSGVDWEVERRRRWDTIYHIRQRLQGRRGG